MKKFLLVVAMLAISASTAFSQGFEWGAKAGINLATQDHDGYTKIKMRTGIYAGIYAEYRIVKRVGIQSELLYSQMGSKREVWGGIDMLGAEGTRSYAHFKNDYLVLPILVKLYVLDGVSMDLGVQFGRMISGKEDNYNYYESAAVVTKNDTSLACHGAVL